MAKSRRPPRARRATPSQQELLRLQQALDVQRAESRDLAERWLQAERERERAEATFRSFYQDAPVGFMQLSRGGTILQLNRTAAALIARQAISSIVGRPLIAFLDHRNAGIAVRHLIRNRRGEAQVVSFLRFKIDPARMAQFVTRESTTEPQASGFDALLLDVSEHLAVQDAVRDSERRYRTIVDTASEGICTLDPQHRLTFVNPRFARMLGAAPEDMIGRPLTDFVPPEDVDAGTAWLQAGAWGSLREMRLRRLDGSDLWTSVSSSRLTDADGVHSGLLAMFTDISHQRELDATRARVVKRLVAAQEAERRRLSLELHDQMGQHLVGLTLGLDSLARLPGLPADGRHLVERLKKVADGLARDAHHLAAELRPAALDDLGLAVAVGNYADRISEQSGLRVDVHCALTRRLDPAIETTVYRVVQEAMTNVVRHAHARTVSVIIEAQPPGLRVVIEDDGVGFDAALVRRGESTRLGVAGMIERAALVGGELTIESSEGHGTSVFLRVPLADEGTSDEEAAPALG